MEKAEKIRFKIIFGLFAVAFLAIIGKAFKVQIVDGEKLTQKSSNQFFRQSTIFPRRGVIYDRNGHPLALNVQTYSIFTIPRNLDSNFTPLKELEAIVPELDFERTRSRIGERSRFTWLARKISLNQEQVEAIENLSGIHIEAVPKRLYPNNQLSAQILGFVGVDNVGLAGLEHRFDKELKGKPTILRYIIDNRGRPVKFESHQVETGNNDVHLSIDKDIQFIAEKHLKAAVKKFDADSGGVGVMHAHTGEILAMANYPSFDPNHPHLIPNSVHRLPFVTDPIEPGSTFKTFTIASALENNVAREDTNYYCERGQLRVGNHIIREAESNRSYEWLSVSEILKYSSNIGTTKIAFDLTYPKLKKTLLDFGFGERTGVELPGESRGIFLHQDNVSPLSLSNVSFGQGLATTGVQMLAAYAAVANGGYYVEPTIIRRNHDDEEVPKRRIISEQTAQTLQDMLVGAVESGTGRNAMVPYFTIAGKTSTAQRASPSGGYDGYIPGFAGFPVGVNDPFVIVVYIDNPKEESIYGNRVAAPIFREIAQHILYNSQEFKNVDLATNLLNDQTRSDRVQVRQAASRHMGSGRVPNFVGLDRVSSGRLANEYGLKIEHRGIGVVSKQEPRAGKPFTRDTVINLRYSPPQFD